MQIIKDGQSRPLPAAGGRWVRLDGAKVTMPSDEQARLAICVEDGWAEYVAPAPTPEELAAQLVATEAVQTARIDEAAGEARRRLVSPGYLVDQEYLMAYEDALAYQAAGYAGAVPAGVQTWADAKGWPAQQAADDILATRALWKGVSAAIRGLRLSGKEAVRAAATAEAKTAAADTVVAQLAAIGG